MLRVRLEVRPSFVVSVVGYSLRPASQWNPTVALGGGPVAARLERFDVPEGNAMGVLLDTGFGFEQGEGQRWFGEAGCD